MKKNTIIKVVNRSNMTVYYVLAELGVRREFAPNEQKEIPFGELQQLSFKPGGMNIIQNNLVIRNAEAMRCLGMRVEPEYYLTERDVIDLLQNGSLDAFLDCLDFAPIGVIELIKKQAVDLPVNDSRKRAAIKEKFGFDVDMALLHRKQVEEAQREQSEETSSGMKAITPGRRVQLTTSEPTATEEAPARRVIKPKYNIINKEE